MYTTTTEFLDLVKARHGLSSDYALADKLGLTRSMVSAYRNGKRMLGDESAMRVAELLELDPGFVLACVEAERSHSPAIRAAWENLADLVKRHGAAAAVMLAVAPSVESAARRAMAGNRKRPHGPAAGVARRRVPGYLRRFALALTIRPPLA